MKSLGPKLLVGVSVVAALVVGCAEPEVTTERRLGDVVSTDLADTTVDDRSLDYQEPEHDYTTMESSASCIVPGVNAAISAVGAAKTCLSAVADGLYFISPAHAAGLDALIAAASTVTTLASVLSYSMKVAQVDSLIDAINLAYTSLLMAIQVQSEETLQNIAGAAMCPVKVLSAKTKLLALRECLANQDAPAACWHNDVQNVQNYCCPSQTICCGWGGPGGDTTICNCRDSCSNGYLTCGSGQASPGSYYHSTYCADEEDDWNDEPTNDGSSGGSAGNGGSSTPSGGGTECYECFAVWDSGYSELLGYACGSSMAEVQQACNNME